MSIDRTVFVPQGTTSSAPIPRPVDARPHRLRRGSQGILCALVAATACGGTAMAQSSGDALNDRVADLERRNNEQQAVIADLANRLDQAQFENTDWLTEQRSEEIRGLVQDVLADADTRASLQGSGLTAGYDNGFFIGSADGNFRLNFVGVIQTRWAYDYRNDPGPDEDANRYGFEIRRAGLIFHGHVIDPSWKYFMQIATVPAAGGGMGLLDAFVEKDFGDGWSVKGGKFRTPFMHEQLVAYVKQLGVERSLLSSSLGIGRSEGIQLAWGNDNVRLTAALFDDFGTIGGTTTPALSEDGDLAVAGRVEWKVLGDWKQYNQFTSAPGSETALVFGGAIAYYKGETGTSSPELKDTRWTLDAVFMSDGWNLGVTYVGRHANMSGGGSSMDQYGILVQGGVHISDEWELFAQYQYGDDDLDDTDALSLVSAGVNYYIAGQRLRWVSDIGYGINGVSSFWANGGANWGTDGTDQDGQFVIRTQFQIIF